MDYQQYYRTEIEKLTEKPVQAKDGIDQAVLLEIGYSLPKSVMDYYAIAGDHEINTEYNQLYPPGEIEKVDDYLVLAEENQGVVVWGIKENGESADPIVFQGQEADGKTEWYSEEAVFSQFIISMWKWQRESFE